MKAYAQRLISSADALLRDAVRNEAAGEDGRPRAEHEPRVADDLTMAHCRCGRRDGDHD